MEDYISIGKLIKSHGLKGDIAIRVDDYYREDFLNTEKIFIEHHGQKIPYFIDGIKKGNLFLLKLEDVSSPEDVHELTNKTLFLASSDVLEKDAKKSDFVYYDLLNYDIVSPSESTIGTILELIEFPQQEMARIVIDENDVLIPMVEEFIVEVSHDLKKVIMNLPDGLLGL